MGNGYIGFLKRSKRGVNEPGSRKNMRDETAQYQINEEFESIEELPNS